MIDDDGENVVPFEENRNQQLIERYRRRRGNQGRNVPALSRHERESGDVTTWYGFRRESHQRKRHNAQMDKIYDAAAEAAYAHQAAMALEGFSYSRALETVADEEREYRMTDPDSLTGEIAEELLLDSAHRIREGTAEIHQKFRRDALGT